VLTAHDDHDVDVVHPPPHLLLPVAGQRFSTRAVFALNWRLWVLRLASEQITKILVVVEVETDEGSLRAHHGLLRPRRIASNCIHDTVCVPARDLVSVVLDHNGKLYVPPRSNPDD